MSNKLPTTNFADQFMQIRALVQTTMFAMQASDSMDERLSNSACFTLDFAIRQIDELEEKITQALKAKA